MTDLQIKCFLTVAEYLNFSRAAEVLFISQPAVTKHVCALERELGFALFNRNTHSVSLTAKGLIMREAFQKIKYIYDETINVTIKNTSAMKTLTIGSLDGLYLDGITDSIRIMKDSHPMLSINFWRGQSDFLLSTLDKDDADVILTFDNQFPNLSGIKFHTLFSSQFCIIVPKGHPFSSGSHSGIPNVSSEKVIIYVKPTPDNKFGHLKDVCRKLSVSADNILITPNFSSIYSSVESGLGVGLIDINTKIPNPDHFIYIPTGIIHNYGLAWKESCETPMILEFAKILSENIVIPDNGKTLS